MKKRVTKTLIPLSKTNCYEKLVYKYLITNLMKHKYVLDYGCQWCYKSAFH